MCLTSFYMFQQTQGEKNEQCSRSEQIGESDWS